MTFPSDVRAWLAKGERGISSETIVGRLTGIRFVKREGWPWDPDDLRRCRILLDACPSIAAHFDEMRDVNPVWRELVDHWDEICRLIDAEKSTGRCPKAYALMRRIIAVGEAEMRGEP